MNAKPLVTVRSVFFLHLVCKHIFSGFICICGTTVALRHWQPLFKRNRIELRRIPTSFVFEDCINFAADMIFTWCCSQINATIGIQLKVNFCLSHYFSRVTYKRELIDHWFTQRILLRSKTIVFFKTMNPFLCNRLECRDNSGLSVRPPIRHPLAFQ